MIAWKVISSNQTFDLYHIQLFMYVYISLSCTTHVRYTLPFNLQLILYYHTSGIRGGWLIQTLIYNNFTIIILLCVYFTDWIVYVSFRDFRRQSFARRFGHSCFCVENVIGCTTCRWNTIWTEIRFHDIMDVASTDYLKTALYSGDNGPDTGNRDSLRLMELGLHLETLHDGSHRINTSVDHLLNDPSLSGEHYLSLQLLLYYVELISTRRPVDFTFE